MRFLGKYELQEQYTVGAVETFAAHPIGGSDRLLVHLFPLPAFTKFALANDDLLNYLQRIAPPALGAVLDGGRYDDGSQAYLVTKFPRHSDDLTEWVEAYKSLPKKRSDAGGAVTPDALKVPHESSRSERVAESPPGDFTRVFRGMGPDRATPVSPSPADPFRDEPSPVRSIPRPVVVPESKLTRASGSLTEQFMGLGEGARLPGSDPSGASEKTPDLDSWVRPKAPEPAALPSGGSSAGEFTKFFRSPFAVPAPNPQTFPVPDVVDQPAPAKSEFTQLFGAVRGGGMASVPSQPLLEPPAQTERGDFTDVFGNARSTPSNEPPPPVWPPDKPVDLPGKVEPPVYFSQQNTNSLPLAPLKRDAGEPDFRSSPDKGSPILGSGRDEGATRVFRPPVQAEAAVPPPVLAPGESQYTRIIRGPQREPVASAAAVEPPAPAGPAKFQMSVPIAMPSIQIPKAPVAPPPPPIPSVQFPPPPALAVPSLPPGPKLVSPKKGGWTAYAPLIVIFNLIFLAAVGLILYFVYKP